MSKYGKLLPSHKARNFQFAGCSGFDANDLLAVMEGLVESTR
jgi:hypothetical protein